MLDRELYHATPMAANTTDKRVTRTLAGFICTVAGSVTITEDAGPDGVVRTLLSAFPVTAGQIYMWRMIGGARALNTVLSGGAAGTLLT